MNTKKIYFVLVVFSAVIILDLVKFFMFGQPALVNWVSWQHWGWVILAPLLLFVSVVLKNRMFIYFNITLYSGVALLAAANHYYFFSSTLTYNCFLFNLIVVSIYFFSTRQTHL